MTTLETANARPARGPVARSGPLGGMGAICRHILRRDRVRMLVWLVSILVLIAYFMFALSTIFDEQALAARGEVMRTPSGIVLGGPGYGIDHYTPLVAMANEMITWIATGLSIMAIIHVVRHTRAEEESSRAELVRASAVGRHAAAFAAMLTLAGHLVVIAALSALTLVVVGDDVPVADAFAFGFGCAGPALVAGAIALSVAQLTEHARAATGISLAAFAVLFAIRAAGDIQERGGSTLSWFSPIAWAQQMRPFVELRWWPILITIPATLAFLALAAFLATRRDFAAALVAARPGRGAAARSLRSPFALAWRQHGGATFWAALGLGLMWFATGTLMASLNDMAADLTANNPALSALFGSDPGAFAASFLSVMALFGTLCTAAFGISAMQRPRAEEAAGRLEIVAAHPVGRARWLGAQIAVVCLGTLIVHAVSVYAMWAGARAVGIEDPDVAGFSVLFGTYAAAVLVFVAVTAALYGWFPQATGVGWILLAVSFVVSFFGPLLDLPEGVDGISPFSWMPNDPFSSDPDLAGAFGVAGAVVVLILLALIGFRRRELRAG